MRKPVANAKASASNAPIPKTLDCLCLLMRFLISNMKNTFQATANTPIADILIGTPPFDRESEISASKLVGSGEELSRNAVCSILFNNSVGSLNVQKITRFLYVATLCTILSPLVKNAACGIMETMSSGLKIKLPTILALISNLSLETFKVAKMAKSRLLVQCVLLLFPLSLSFLLVNLSKVFVRYATSGKSVIATPGWYPVPGSRSQFLNARGFFRKL